MTDSRSVILERIRSRKKQGIEKQIPTRTEHSLPTHIPLDAEALASYFGQMAKRSAATLSSVAELSMLPGAVKDYLSTLPFAQIPTDLHLNGPVFTPLPWTQYSLTPTAIDSALVSVCLGFCGIAETGSIALLAEPSCSSAAYFLPEILIVALYKTDILAHQEACWLKLSRDYPKLPRTVTLVTGPSRTGDIEQKLVIGAHGPRYEHIVLIEA